MKYYKVLHLTDQHFSTHEPNAIKQSLEAIRIVKPSRIVLGGDMLDCYMLSRFDKDPTSKKRQFKRELKFASAYMREVRKAAGPKCVIDYTLGNHEFRVSKYLNSKAAALVGLEALSWSNLLPFDECNINLFEYGRGPKIGGVLFTHGSIIRKFGGKSAITMTENSGSSVAMGHTHRLGAIFQRRGNRVYEGYESGCLCKLWPDYETHRPDWQQGFSLFKFWGAQNVNHIWVPIHLTQKNPLVILKD